MMTKKERIQAAIAGEKPDKLPYSFWTHLPGIDLNPELLAEKTYEFYKKYDIDFIKTMNNGMYAIEDFGCEIDYSDIAKGGVAKVTKTPIHEAKDWHELKPCSVKEGSLARELKGLKLILDKVKNEDVPVIFTIFSPLTTANKLSGNTLLQFIFGELSAKTKVDELTGRQCTCTFRRERAFAVQRIVGVDGSSMVMDCDRNTSS